MKCVQHTVWASGLQLQRSVCMFCTLFTAMCRAWVTFTPCWKACWSCEWDPESLHIRWCYWLLVLRCVCTTGLLYLLWWSAGSVGLQFTRRPCRCPAVQVFTHVSLGLPGCHVRQRHQGPSHSLTRSLHSHIVRAAEHSCSCCCCCGWCFADLALNLTVVPPRPEITVEHK